MKKRMRVERYARRFVAVLIALFIILSFPFASSDGTADASSRTGQVHLVLYDKRGADNEYSDAAVAWAFSTVGVKVTAVYSLRKVNPKKYDGLIIPGGLNDIDPSLYGAKRSKKTYDPDIEFDKRQIRAIRRFANANKPIFGICRGFQVINVAYGGTMKQNIKRHQGWRTVKNVKGSWIYKIYGKTEKTYHSHHQGIKKLGEGLIATSYDKQSGEIESFVHESLPIYAVQWHPESFMKYNPDAKLVLKAFKKVCLKYRKK